MSEELIVRHGSPTLAGLKTGSLFSCACPDGAELCRTLRSWNRRLAPKGVRALGLRLLKGRALFGKYSHCTRVYCDRYARGVPLERLTVAG